MGLPRLRLHASLATCAALCLLALPGFADGVERAREGVRAGRYVPLERVVDWVGQRYYGRLLEVEFEDDDEDEPPTYEVEWLTPAGHVVEFEFDARDGSLLETEGRGLEEARRE